MSKFAIARRIVRTAWGTSLTDSVASASISCSMARKGLAVSLPAVRVGVSIGSPAVGGGTFKGSQVPAIPPDPAGEQDEAFHGMGDERAETHPEPPRHPARRRLRAQRCWQRRLSAALQAGPLHTLR